MRSLGNFFGAAIVAFFVCAFAPLPAHATCNGTGSAADASATTDASGCQWVESGSGTPLATSGVNGNTAPWPAPGGSCSALSPTGQCSNGVRHNNNVNNILYNYNYNGGPSTDSCRFIDNNSGNDLFVPQLTEDEFMRFLQYAPVGVAAGYCVQGTGVSYTATASYGAGYELFADWGTPNLATAASPQTQTITIPLPTTRVNYTTPYLAPVTAGMVPNATTGLYPNQVQFSYTRQDCKNLVPTNQTVCWNRTIVETQTIQYYASGNPACANISPQSVLSSSNQPTHVDCDGQWTGPLVTSTFTVDGVSTDNGHPSSGVSNYMPPTTCVDNNGNAVPEGGTWTVTNNYTSNGQTLFGPDMSSNPGCPSGQAGGMLCPATTTQKYVCLNGAGVAQGGPSAPVWQESATGCTGSCCALPGDGGSVFGTLCTGAVSNMAHMYAYNMTAECIPTNYADGNACEEPLTQEEGIPPAQSDLWTVDNYETVFGQNQEQFDLLAPSATTVPSLIDYVPGVELYTSQLNIPLQSQTNGFPGDPSLQSDFAICYDGGYTPTQTGAYQFVSAANNGVVVTIENNGSQPVIYQLGQLSNQTPYPLVASAPVMLQAGTDYHFKVEFFQGPPPQLGLQLWVLPPGTAQFPVPQGQQQVNVDPNYGADGQSYPQLTNSNILTLSGPPGGTLSCPRNLCGSDTYSNIGWWWDGSPNAPGNNSFGMPCVPGTTTTPVTTSPITLAGAGNGNIQFQWTCAEANNPSISSSCTASAMVECGASQYNTAADFANSACVGAGTTDTPQTQPKDTTGAAPVATAINVSGNGTNANPWTYQCSLNLHDGNSYTSSICQATYATPSCDFLNGSTSLGTVPTATTNGLCQGQNIVSTPTNITLQADNNTVTWTCASLYNGNPQTTSCQGTLTPSQSQSQANGGGQNGGGQNGGSQNTPSQPAAPQCNNAGPSPWFVQPLCNAGTPNTTNPPTQTIDAATYPAAFSGQSVTSAQGWVWTCSVGSASVSCAQIMESTSEQ